MWAALLATFSFATAVAAVGDAAFTISVNLTGWSPQFWGVDMYWKFDQATGTVSSWSGSPWVGTRPFNDLTTFYLVGNQIVPYGVVHNEGGANHGKALVTDGPNFVVANKELQEPHPLPDKLADFGRFKLGSYKFKLDPERNSSVALSFVTLDIPIVTKA